MELKDYFVDKMDEVARYALHNGSTNELEFLRSSLDATVDYGDLEDYDLIDKYESDRKWLPDAVSINTEFNQLIVIVNIFVDSDWEDLGTITTQDISKYYKRSLQFVADCKNSLPDDIAKPNSQLFHLAATIKEEWNQYKNIKMLIITNKKLSRRLDEKKVSKGIPNKNTSFGIWDINRYFSVESSQSEREDIEVDFSDKPLEILKASSTDEMQSFLVMMPGEKLAEIYGRWKSRILEQNVRSYLQNRSNVNKGIMLTLRQTPERFFAYNNGLTVTGTQLDFDSSSGHLNKIHNLQIVNGGQTTASIYRASVEKIDLSKVDIQLKLTVISKGKVEELVPNIAKFANTQNPVNAADLFSNHPFHKRMEQISRKLVPPANSSFGLGKWFYERSRGQYLNEQIDKTPAQKKDFQRDNPKTKLITKTDLALIINAWEEKPSQVSKGAQANFKLFAETLGPSEQWDKDNTQYNEGYFISFICKAIVMRALRKEIPKQDWYEGFPANIVAYSISWFAYCMKKSKVALNTLPIWKSQECPENLLDKLLSIAREVNDHILGEKGNPTTYAKSKGCWDSMRNTLLPEEFNSSDSLFVEISEILEETKIEKKEQQKINKIVSELHLFQINSSSWTKIHEFMQKYNKMSPEKDRLIKMLIENKIPQDFELKKLMLDLKEYEDLGGEIIFK